MKIESECQCGGSGLEAANGGLGDAMLVELGYTGTLPCCCCRRNAWRASLRGVPGSLSMSEDEAKYWLKPGPKA